MKEKIDVLIPEEEVNAKIREMGKQISEDYAGKDIHMICVLKGAAYFMIELSKYITVPVTFDFLSVSSYGDSTESSGVVRLNKDLDEPLDGRNVLVVEDIVDTGRTMSYLLSLFRKRNPKSLKLCTLLDKPERRVCEVNADYVGFEIPDEYIVGCGLDYAKRYRNLTYIGTIQVED